MTQTQFAKFLRREALKLRSTGVTLSLLQPELQREFMALAERCERLAAAAASGDKNAAPALPDAPR